MVALIIISSIIVYVFIGLFVMFVWSEYRYRHCSCIHHKYCDHEAGAIMMGIFWPLGPIFYLLGIVLWSSAMTLADKVMGDDSVQDK